MADPKDDAASLRDDEDDHDLLTFGEAGERLRVEIAKQQEAIARLAASGAQAETTAAEERLAALRAAAERQQDGRWSAEQRAAFFGTDA